MAWQQISPELTEGYEEVLYVASNE